MRIYHLRPDITYPGTTGAFSTWSKQHGLLLEPKPIAKKWKPPIIRIQPFEEYFDPSAQTKAAAKKIYERGLPDFCTGLDETFSRRAVEVLSPWFRAAGEFLPVRLAGSRDEYFYYHCFRLCDALDVRNSLVSLPDDEPMLRHVHELGYAFHARKLAGYDVFRLSYLAARSWVYVSQTILDAVAAHGLTGFGCTELWRSADEPPIKRSAADRKWIERELAKRRKA